MTAGHRHGTGHEHEFEPQRGLPEALPPGEQVLWQGSPDWRMLARRAFHVRKLVVYFAVLAGLRMTVMVGSGAGAREMLVSLLWMTLLGATAIGLLSLVAWLSARSAVYTITDRRVVMRIGIVLTLTFNIPFKRIVGAGLRLDANGSGDLPLTLSGDDRIAWLHLWPHARPWKLARPEPMLRSVPQAAEVAALLSEAWSRRTGLAAGTQTFGDDGSPAAAGSGRNDHAGAQHPALAGR
jgi:hypothetical protein